MRSAWGLLVPNHANVLRVLPALGLLALWLALAACGRGEEPYRPAYSDNPSPRPGEYVFAPHPLLNPQRMAEVYGAMVDRLNHDLAPAGIRLRLEASSSYSAYNEKLRRGEPHFVLPNPYQLLLAQQYGYVIFGKVEPDDDFRGIILLRKDSPLKTLAGLKGATVSFPAPTALAATLMPELYMRENGLDPRKDITQLFSGTHESALMNLGLGVSAAACTWPPAWADFRREHPDMAARMEVRWQTGVLPNNGLGGLASVPEGARAQVAAALFGLSADAEGRRLLKAAGIRAFVPADAATYAPVAAFVERYNRLVRQLKGLDE